MREIVLRSPISILQRFTADDSGSFRVAPRQPHTGEVAVKFAGKYYLIATRTGLAVLPMTLSCTTTSPRPINARGISTLI
jgi:hypothetical protein